MKEPYNIKDDEALLKSFFSEHAEHIADNGFTERVVLALPQGEADWLTANLHLRYWSIGLNVAAVIGGFILLFSLDFFGAMRTFLIPAAERLLVTLMTLDWDALLVRTMLFIHHLPEVLPSPLQLSAIVLASLILLPLCIQKIVKEV